MRLQISALVGLLTTKQLLFTDEFSQVLLHEFSPFDYSNSSDDGQGSVQDRAKDLSIKRMVKSKDKTNQRFIDMLRMQHAQRYGVKIGFKGFNQNDHDPTN